MDRDKKKFPEQGGAERPLRFATARPVKQIEQEKDY